MPNLINTDNAGNTFYNYITSTEGKITGWPGANIDGFFNGVFGVSNWVYRSVDSNYYYRFIAPGLEQRTGAVTTSTFFQNCRVNHFVGNTSQPNVYALQLSPHTVNGATSVTTQNGTANNSAATDIVFRVGNNFAWSQAEFSDVSLSTLKRFLYVGYLRERSYNSSFSYPQGLVLIDYKLIGGSTYFRVQSANNTATSNLSSAANAITSPPIVCTPATNSGSATWTDVVIRDAAAPNNPVGKLWNCVDAPASYTVGGLYKNVGAYDADGSISEQDVYLCVMPWGERKLLMRVWTENV